MLLRLDRITSTADETIGALYVDGVFECFTLEDEHRAQKLIGETRIPAGSYQVLPRTYGGFYERYKSRFGPGHRFMLEVMNVPNFTDILFHCGNTDEDTSGCILVGESADTNGHASGMSIGRSAAAYRRFYAKVKSAVEADEAVKLIIFDDETISIRNK